MRRVACAARCIGSGFSPVSGSPTRLAVKRPHGAKGRHGWASTDAQRHGPSSKQSQVWPPPEAVASRDRNASPSCGSHVVVGTIVEDVGDKQDDSRVTEILPPMRDFARLTT
jgi:hypothetical protein